MIVFHGTGRANFEGLSKGRPRCDRRAYLGYREAFSTTTDFWIASLFAIRRSPPAALTDEREVGIVLEYELAPSSKPGVDWTPARCSGVLQDEKEIAVFKPSVLRLRAVWNLERGEWTRKARKAASRGR